jgi:hypothetical protein
VDVPITFEYKGKTSTGHLSSGTGSSGTMYDHWHLMVDKFYYGQLNYSGHCEYWLFTSDRGLFEDLSDYFEAYLVGWFG